MKLDQELLIRVLRLNCALSGFAFITMLQVNQWEVGLSQALMLLILFTNAGCLILMKGSKL